MRATLAVFAGLVLAGCQTVSASAPSGLSGLSLVPAPGGLLVEGSGGREIGFGRDQTGALESVARVEGTSPRAVACPSGRQGMETRTGLTLVFERGTFVGWEGAQGRAGRGCT
ncbi:hypothetical protein [Jannaschia marina]|uniref:hypothetical protein n=1 Tax=Jannaschia marina TaxID=2741674 RepID=UPI0015CC6AA5|nr:hypothetical protein [Jannaschia marina]